MKYKCFVLIVLVFCVVAMLIGCDHRYQRISFASEMLGDSMQCIHEQTAVMNMAKADFPQTLPIYQIKENSITLSEIMQMENQLGITNWYYKEHSGNKFVGLIAPYDDPARGYFYELNMSDDELEALAWETFRKIPFLPGEYEYLGISGESTIWNLEHGERISSVTVSFRRTLNKIRILGSDVCKLTFDGSGLQEIIITSFDYKEIGQMNLIPMEDALSKVKSPDYFSLSQNMETIDTLRVDKIKLLLVNQYYNGCTILQPIYNFIGKAVSAEDFEGEFSSRVIAIPESYTYEKTKEK